MLGKRTSFCFGQDCGDAEEDLDVVSGEMCEGELQNIVREGKSGVFRRSGREQLK